MKKIVLVYGSIAGVVIIASAIVGITLADASQVAALEWLGYLVMIAALSLVFVGVKQHRDQDLGGVIRFGSALKVGLGIVLVASVIYVAVWEVYLATTDYAFMDEYAASIVDRRAEDGATPEELEAVREEMAVMAARYDSPPVRVLITFLEIFPVGLLVALGSAAVLRRPEVLPAG